MVAISSVIGVVLLAMMVGFVPADPTVDDVAWGAAGGVAGGFGVMLFYRALATGVMSVVAPVTAVTGAVVPVAAGLLLGEQPGAITLVGIAIAIAAVALLAAKRRATASSRAPGHARPSCSHSERGSGSGASSCCSTARATTPGSGRSSRRVRRRSS